MREGGGDDRQNGQSDHVDMAAPLYTSGTWCERGGGAALEIKEIRRVTGTGGGAHRNI